MIGYCECCQLWGLLSPRNPSRLGRVAMVCMSCAGYGDDDIASRVLHNEWYPDSAGSQGAVGMRRNRKLARSLIYDDVERGFQWHHSIRWRAYAALRFAGLRWL
jgi:hypothetical protein